MKKAVRIDAPVPSVEETARVLGVPPSRVKELVELVNSTAGGTGATAQVPASFLHQRAKRERAERGGATPYKIVNTSPTSARAKPRKGARRRDRSSAGRS
jgi:hypothetical protein